MPHGSSAGVAGELGGCREAPIIIPGVRTTCLAGIRFAIRGLSKLTESKRKESENVRRTN